MTFLLYIYNGLLKGSGWKVKRAHVYKSWYHIHIYEGYAEFNENGLNHTQTLETSNYSGSLKGQSKHVNQPSKDHGTTDKYSWFNFLTKANLYIRKAVS